MKVIGIDVSDLLRPMRCLAILPVRCGPCKLMLPKITKLATELDDVIFLKLDCNKHNKVCF